MIVRYNYVMYLGEYTPTNPPNLRWEFFGPDDKDKCTPSGPNKMQILIKRETYRDGNLIRTEYGLKGRPLITSGTA